MTGGVIALPDLAEHVDGKPHRQLRHCRVGVARAVAHHDVALPAGVKTNVVYACERHGYHFQGVNPFNDV